MLEPLPKPVLAAQAPLATGKSVGVLVSLPSVGGSLDVAVFGALPDVSTESSPVEATGSEIEAPLDVSESGDVGAEESTVGLVDEVVVDEVVDDVDELVEELLELELLEVVAVEVEDVAFDEDVSLGVGFGVTSDDKLGPEGRSEAPSVPQPLAMSPILAESAAMLGVTTRSQGEVRSFQVIARYCPQNDASR